MADEGEPLLGSYPPSLHPTDGTGIQPQKLLAMDQVHKLVKNCIQGDEGKELQIHTVSAGKEVMFIA